MRISVLGTGNVGTTLATGFADKGNDVVLGSRDPSRARVAEWVAADPVHRGAASLHDAVASADVVFIAVPGRALPETIDAIGREPFDDTTVVDVTNPFGTNAAGETVSTFGDDDSGAEYLQRQLPDAHVVKAFNEIDYPEMLHPDQSSFDAVHIAGEDEAAKRVVSDLAGSLGWKVEDVGGLSHARELEHAVLKRYS